MKGLTTYQDGSRRETFAKRLAKKKKKKGKKYARYK